MAQSSNARRRILGALLIAAVSAGAYTFFELRPADEQGTVFYGNVDIRDVSLAFRVSGRVEQVLKTEGDEVAPGETLALLDQAPYRLALEQAQAAAQVAVAELANVEAGARREDISQARAVLAERKAAQERAQDHHQRIDQLQESGAATTQALVDAKAALDQANAAVTAGQAVLSKLLNGARSEEIRIAHARAQQAQTAVALAELHLEDTKLRAKDQGVVVTRAIEPGAMVLAGSPALVIAFQDPVWIRAYAEEPELARLSPGTTVRVFTDSRPEQPYEGQVGYVSPQAEFTPKNVETAELRTSLVYRFRVVVKNHDGGLRQGMPVTVLPKKGS